MPKSTDTLWFDYFLYQYPYHIILSVDNIYHCSTVTKASENSVTLHQKCDFYAIPGRLYIVPTISEKIICFLNLKLQ